VHALHRQHRQQQPAQQQQQVVKNGLRAPLARARNDDSEEDEQALMEISN
jgi:hypothetical protein